MMFDRKRVLPLATPKNIVVIRWDGKLGDAIVSSFFYREARKLKEVTVTVITTPELADFHRYDFGAHRVLISPVNPGLANLCKLALQLRNIDTVVHPVGRIRARELLFLYLLKPRNVFSLDDDIGWVNGKMHAATISLAAWEKYAFILRQFGATDIDGGYCVPDSTRWAAHEGDRRPCVIFNPFASRPDKSLSEAKAICVLRRIADRLPSWEVSILYRPDTHGDALAMKHAAARPNITLAASISTFTDAISAVREASLVISVDTGFVHIADGLSKNLVAICPQIGQEFNPWLPRLSPRTRIVRCMQDPLACRRTAKKDMDNFDDDDVVRAIDSVLAPDLLVPG
jgi:ADP-heptose:LPS heptosyltransferase